MCFNEKQEIFGHFNKFIVHKVRFIIFYNSVNNNNNNI